MKGMCYFFFRGYYFVDAASELLTENGIPNRIVKAPVRISNGCSFAVMTNSIDAEESSRMIRKSGIEIEQTIML